MAENWTAIATEIAAAIASVGFTAQIEVLGTQTGPEYDPIQGPATLTDIKAIDGQIERRDSNGIITETVRVLTIGAVDLVPEKGWRVLVRGVYHRIAKVMPLAPGDGYLLYELELEG